MCVNEIEGKASVTRRPSGPSPIQHHIHFSRPKYKQFSLIYKVYNLFNLQLAIELRKFFFDSLLTFDPNPMVTCSFMLKKLNS